MRRMTATVLLAAAVFVPFGYGSAQIPDKFENLRVLPKDITRDSLVQIMRSFSFALGVRCQYCHVGGDGVSFEGVVFKSDDKAEKRRARYMLQMVDTINTKLLAALPDRRTPPTSVACATCHHGLPRPTNLEATLTETLDRAGIDSAVAQYRQLRQNTTLQGKYDFSPQVLIEFATHLAGRSKTAEAITILQLDGEFNPTLPEIDFRVGQLHEQRGEKDQAIASYRAVLQKNPNSEPAKRRLTALGAPPS
jgi:tetratricopeptide (TPR) repeat protein